MWFSVLLLAAWVCLADVTHTEASRVPLRRSRRVVGGTIAPHIPWQAMVFLSDKELDGGSASGALISDRWILTAGRNLFAQKSRKETQGKKPLIPKVYLGIHLRSEANASSEVTVKKVVLHPNFQNQSDWDNDLALIQLKEPVVMSDKVTPIPLPERGQDLAMGGTGVMTGWGYDLSFTAAPYVKHIIVPVANHSACKAEYDSDAFKPTVDDNMFCTGRGRFQENVCFGDAGGALAVKDAETGDVYATGILSYDKACSTHNYAVYMKISSYLHWINSVTRGDTETSATLRSAAMSNMYSRHRVHILGTA